MGDAGCSIALVIAVLIFSKRADTKAVAKMSAPMAVFNINEPVVFGMPIVLNPIYFIPWLLVPVVLTIVAYTATAMGLVPYVHVVVPWFSCIVCIPGNRRKSCRRAARHCQPGDRRRDLVGIRDSCQPRC